jgi:hypothetical protein
MKNAPGVSAGRVSKTEDYQLAFFANVSLRDFGKDQRGFLEAGRALIMIGSPVKGFTPLPALGADDGETNPHSARGLTRAGHERLFENLLHVAATEAERPGARHFGDAHEARVHFVNERKLRALLSHFDWSPFAHSL